MPPIGPLQKKNEAPRKASPLMVLVLLFGLVGSILFLGLVYLSGTPKGIGYTDLLDLSKNGEIARLTLSGRNKVYGEVRDPNSPVASKLELPRGRFSVILPQIENQANFFAELIQEDALANKPALDTKSIEPLKIYTEEDQGLWVNTFLTTILPIALILLFFFVLLPRMRDPMGGGFASNFIKSSAKRFDKTMAKTLFKDVAGMENAKKELEEIVEFLREPKKFERLGAQVPRGVLLVGPPGTGKTLLARAVAGEAGVAFFSINGSEFIQMFVGVGASRVRDLFRTARENAPCLIFIDEIDAVGRMRGAGVGGGSDEREQTLNQILSEMDGFSSTETVIVIAATNRPDVIDAALLRPGRFDRQVTIDRPTWQGRTEILVVHTRNKPLAPDVDLEKIAKRSVGMSGAELRNLCNEAAIHAARKGKEKIDASDFDAAAERILLGVQRDNKYAPEEQKRTAYHEAGHALCAWFEPKAHPLWKVSILPRGRAAGVTAYQLDDDKIDSSQSELMAWLVTIMGGRAADKIISGEPMSGESGDLKQATRIARTMVTQFGMSERLGPVAFRQGEEHVFLGKEIHESRDFSEGTAQIIDQEVQRILREAEERAKNLVIKYRHQLELLTQALLEREELNRDEIEQLWGARPKLDDAESTSSTSMTSSTSSNSTNSSTSQGE